jgi:hypothetical protein
MSLPKDRRKRHTKIVAQIMKTINEQGKPRQRLHFHMLIRDLYKTISGCEYCGYNEHPSALQFDHIDPSTKYRDRNGKLVSPSLMIHRSLQVMLHEFSICQILCANCHAVHTHTVQRVKVDVTQDLLLAA